MGKSHAAIRPHGQVMCSDQTTWAHHMQQSDHMGKSHAAIRPHGHGHAVLAECKGSPETGAAVRPLE